jgi:hypothetical protein
MSVSSKRCVMSGRGLCAGVDYSCEGVMPSVVCLNVIMRSQ